MSDRDKLIEAAAKEYPRVYEIKHMNADTPRLSGAEYLVHGFKAGVTWADANPKPDEHVERLVEAVKRYWKLAPVDGWHFSDCDSVDEEGACSCGTGPAELALKEALQEFEVKNG